MFEISFEKEGEYKTGLLVLKGSVVSVFFLPVKDFHCFMPTHGYEIKLVLK